MAAFAFGMSRFEFREEIFERRPQLWRSGFTGPSLGWSLIDRALDLQDPTRELLKVLRRGRIEPDQYVEQFVDIGVRRRRILKPKLYALLAEGATLVLNRIELVSPEIRELCMQVGRFVGAQTSCNAYATIGDLAATNVHWDTHDVFVVQAAGRKHWRVYEPTHLLPISSQISNDRKDEVPTEPFLDEVLEKGDVLYVPRGWWHRVEPTLTSDTIHFTIAVHTPLILDFLVWASATKLPELLEVRHSLLGGELDRTRVAEAAAAIASALNDETLLAAFYSRSRERERGGTGFEIARVMTGENPLARETILSINSRHAGPDQSSYMVNGIEIALSGPHRHILDILSTDIDSSLGDLAAQLPYLTWSQLHEIARDLIRADLIFVAGAGDLEPAAMVSADNELV